MEKDTKEQFEIQGNELMQTTNYIVEESSQNAIVSTFQKTLEDYKNGKETAELLCSISDYYDENGEIKVSKDTKEFPMIIPLFSVVKPMVLNNNGEDIEMSKGKQFQVVGSEVFYDGAVWQKLTLLEI